ncbi:MAG: hypothetical protein COV72_00865 [Candidatus Omnitrophica bacterium CG11_big_fil_rev_8_21_14_0_20_42_13]|uniref:Uncharacterized protein n=1 Tax=Candidatus Ghiorseimicrobium undicola TaxID=1974746 RepID=A0A2H0LZR3_9BACT|nr:MAG: hypothetical protein COV72_00865 [Candidatus Omnitrophica bacterium CG11_big_fil_rev_8_21_14_0_20_42_13]
MDNAFFIAFFFISAPFTESETPAYPLRQGVLTESETPANYFKLHLCGKNVNIKLSKVVCGKLCKFACWLGLILSRA